MRNHSTDWNNNLEREYDDDNDDDRRQKANEKLMEPTN